MDCVWELICTASEKAVHKSVPLPSLGSAPGPWTSPWPDQHSWMLKPGLTSLELDWHWNQCWCSLFLSLYLLFLLSFPLSLFPSFPFPLSPSLIHLFLLLSPFTIDPKPTAVFLHSSQGLIHQFPCQGCNLLIKFSDCGPSDFCCSFWSWAFINLRCFLPLKGGWTGVQELHRCSQMYKMWLHAARNGKMGFSELPQPLFFHSKYMWRYDENCLSSLHQPELGGGRGLVWKAKDTG